MESNTTQNINWKENNYLFKNFTEELTQEWINHGCNKKETREWLEGNLKSTDAKFAQWLRDVKKVDVEWFTKEGDEEELRKEFQKYLEESSIHEQIIVMKKNDKEDNNIYTVKLCDDNFSLEVGFASQEDADFFQWEIDNHYAIKEFLSNLNLEFNEENKKKIYPVWLEYIEERNNPNPKLDIGTIEKLINDFGHFKPSWNNELTSEQETLIDELIPNKKLRKRYKEYGLCRECDQPKTGAGWCQPCNSQHFKEDFGKWTSGNEEIDKFIQKYQLEAVSNFGVLEWIPYDKFTNVEFIEKGGFSEVYKAEWSDDGPIGSWNTKTNKWKRRLIYQGEKVVLKSLPNSENVTTEFLQEITYHKLVGNFLLGNENIHGRVVPCWGISKDPKTNDHIMVMRYMKNGNLRQYLNDNYIELEFSNKISLLSSISRGLAQIHEKDLIHHDFHPGNILNGDLNYFYVTDLGLCRPASEANSEKLFGVLPYVAPEVLNRKPYTKAADIYSFGMIAYEIFSGLPPYHNVAHTRPLAEKVCAGLRPDLGNIQAPQLLKDLIMQCWDADPTKRPTAIESWRLLMNWGSEVYKGDTEFGRQYKEAGLELVDMKAKANGESRKKMRKIAEEKARKKALYKLLAELYKEYKDQVIEIKNEEEVKKARRELFSEFRKQHGYKEEEIVEAWKTFDNLLSLTPNSSTTCQTHPQAVYTSRLLDFKNLSEPQNNLSQEWQRSALLELQIKEIEEEIGQPLTDELKKNVEEFIEANQKALKNKEDKTRNGVREREEKLSKKLREKKFSPEVIKKVIRRCEKLVALEQSKEGNKQLQSHVEIPANQ